MCLNISGLLSWGPDLSGPLSRGPGLCGLNYQALQHAWQFYVVFEINIFLAISGLRLCGLKLKLRQNDTTPFSAILRRLGGTDSRHDLLFLQLEHEIQQHNIQHMRGIEPMPAKWESDTMATRPQPHTHNAYVVVCLYTYELLAKLIDRRRYSIHRFDKCLSNGRNHNSSSPRIIYRLYPSRCSILSFGTMLPGSFFVSSAWRNTTLCC